MLDISHAKAALHAIRLLMDENREHLIEIDSVVGDGDLGLTMAKAFSTADDQMADSDEGDLGKFLMQAGMAMGKAAPSTMGSLVATGFMRGGKALRDKTPGDKTPENKTKMDAGDIALFFRAFSDGIMERGKTKPGNKTIVDVMDPVATALERAAGEGADGAELAKVAGEAATAGEAAAREMTAQHGKAAIYREQTVGKPDPGATAGALIVRGFFSVLAG